MTKKIFYTTLLSLITLILLKVSCFFIVNKIGIKAAEVITEIKMNG